MIMGKWKCGICNNEFDNFQAQGFGGTIYCPLCYFKELYRRTELERERLNNIISQIETLVINHNCDTGDIYYKYNGKYLKSELKERIIELVELKEE